MKAKIFFKNSKIAVFLAILTFFGVLGHILAFPDIERSVLLANIKFWEKNPQKITQEQFLAHENNFLGKRGPFWVPVTPKNNEIYILNL